LIYRGQFAVQRYPISSNPLSLQSREKTENGLVSGGKRWKLVENLQDYLIYLMNINKLKFSGPDFRGEIIFLGLAAQESERTVKKYRFGIQGNLRTKTKLARLAEGARRRQGATCESF
jgi:hypothetical protein